MVFSDSTVDLKEDLSLPYFKLSDYIRATCHERRSSSETRPLSHRESIFVASLEYFGLRFARLRLFLPPPCSSPMFTSDDHGYSSFSLYLSPFVRMGLAVNVLK